VSSAVADRSWTVPPTGLPRLLAAVSPDGRQASLEDHLAAYGVAPHAGPELIDLVERSGLRGRGGGGFPTGRKLAAVASHGGRPVVVVNAAEGEPASSKDRMLVRYVPHLVLDGAVLAADALGARRAIVALGGSELDLRALADAIDARARRRVDRHVELVPVAAPRGFVAGEETALVRFLNGGPAKPTFTPPRPFERGVGGAPTLVQNAETLAHLALIARFGPEWFRDLGTADEPGSVLVSLSGAVTRPGVYEIELGMPFAELLRRAGGESEPLRAFLVGGYFGSWLDSSRIDTPLSDAALVPLGARLGARAIVALPEEACGLVETARVARYLAAESAAQCGPCVNGLDAIAGGLVRLAAGKGDSRSDLRRWVAAVRGRGACRHPDGAAAFVASALTCFADEVELHLRGRCSATGRSVLRLPRGKES
jgi:NADH:ubiquinone oxidoreductase subunit F (NADH-binding)